MSPTDPLMEDLCSIACSDDRFDICPVSLVGSPHLQQSTWAYPLKDPPYRSKDWVPLGLGWIQITNVACCENCLSIVVF